MKKWVFALALVLLAGTSWAQYGPQYTAPKDQFLRGLMAAPPGGLGSANIWTGLNTFQGGATVSGPFIASGTSSFTGASNSFTNSVTITTGGFTVSTGNTLLKALRTDGILQARGGITDAFGYWSVAAQTDPTPGLMTSSYTRLAYDPQFLFVLNNYSWQSLLYPGDPKAYTPFTYTSLDTVDIVVTDTTPSISDGDVSLCGWTDSNLSNRYYTCETIDVSGGAGTYTSSTSFFVVNSIRTVNLVGFGGADDELFSAEWTNPSQAVYDILTNPNPTPGETILLIEKDGLSSMGYELVTTVAVSGQVKIGATPAETSRNITCAYNDDNVTCVEGVGGDYINTAGAYAPWTVSDNSGSVSVVAVDAGWWHPTPCLTDINQASGVCEIGSNGAGGVIIEPSWTGNMTQIDATGGPSDNVAGNAVGIICPDSALGCLWTPQSSGYVNPLVTVFWASPLAGAVTIPDGDPMFLEGDVDAELEDNNTLQLIGFDFSGAGPTTWREVSRSVNP